MSASGGELRSQIRLGVIAFIETDEEQVSTVSAEVVAAKGRTLQTIARLLIVWFDSATNATRCFERLATTRCRAGISAGDVVLESGLAHGLPVVEASRLKDLAGSDQFLCTSRFARLAGLSSEAMAPPGWMSLKGIDRPVAVVMLHRDSSALGNR